MMLYASVTEKTRDKQKGGWYYCGGGGGGMPSLSAFIVNMLSF